MSAGKFRLLSSKLTEATTRTPRSSAIRRRSANRGIGRPGQAHVEDVHACLDRRLDRLGERERRAYGSGGLFTTSPEYFDLGTRRETDDAELVVPRRADDAGDCRAVSVSLRVPGECALALDLAAQIRVLGIDPAVDDADPDISTCGRIVHAHQFVAVIAVLQLE